MGHYASEMGYVSPSMIPETDRETIEKFFDGKDYYKAPCPRCGAKIDWGYLEADDMILHIKWHKNLEAWLHGMTRPYPGLEI